ncbi:hypothetical protein AB5I39_10080 [Sphingomonas sp. MMS24-J45]|uniref:hypothetical protein n=1 Tax=Sphingomonas sp. MMS24-J45 TaxID=3238806 RepID=UPI0038512CBC
MGRERRFFLVMAVVIFLIVLIGFGSQVVLKRVWFTDFPWPVHLHAIVFSSWIVLYLVQNWLVADGSNIGFHRRLGWLGSGIATVMVPLGIAATLMAVARGSINGVFPLGLFLALDILHILGFGGLTLAAVLLRNHADWHKRLMFCGTVLTTAPALSRLLGLFHLGTVTPIAVITALAAAICAGIVFDLANWHRVHPAYWWGLGTVTLVEVLVVPIGSNSAVSALATGLAG